MFAVVKRSLYLVLAVVILVHVNRRSEARDGDRETMSTQQITYPIPSCASRHDIGDLGLSVWNFGTFGSIATNPVQFPD